MTASTAAAEYGEPQTLVLYATPDAWRYCIYTDRVSLEGALGEWVAPDAAQREAEDIAGRFFGRDLGVHWDVFDPGWWVAHVDQPGTAPAVTPQPAPVALEDGTPLQTGEAGDLPTPIP